MNSKFLLLVSCGSLVACGGAGSADATGETAITITQGGSTGGDSATDSGPDSGPGSNPSGPDDDGPAEDDDGPGGMVSFDVGAGGANYCGDKEAGIYCSDNSAIECDGDGNEVSNDSCVPAFCEETVGCVTCLEGMIDCQGASVVACNTDGPVPVWEVIETCDPAANMVCDIPLGTCIPINPIGGTEPTGEYYQYADFLSSGGVFLGGYDVDGIDDRLYISNFSQGIDVYEVELLDSDGDGLLEPNQHPDNPEEPGEIEQRVLTHVDTVPFMSGLSLGAGEIFVLEDRLFVGGASIDEHIFATGAETQITAAPAWASRFAQIGYDEVNGVWYGSNESNRRVFQHDAATNTWGLAFDYPELAGSHMDGIEVVTDPNTGTPFVYVSDMTSDFIGQYRKDPELGWVQENLFEYEGTVGAYVEGMGFGAFLHFWATSGSSLYEVGGGDLQDFVQPEG